MEPMFNVSLQALKEKLFFKVKKNLETKKITNFNVGGVFRGFLEIVAYFIYLLYRLLNIVFTNAYAQYATGLWLRLKCLEIDVKENKASKARGKFLFGRLSKTDNNILIKKDTLIKTKMNSKGEIYQYYVDADIILAKGDSSVLVPITAAYQGKAYNIASFTELELVNPITGIDYVKALDNWITDFGTDDEDDESLRERYYLEWKSLSKGNIYEYEKIAKEVIGVAEAIVIPVARGKGTIDVIISSVEGAPSLELVQKVQVKIDLEKYFDGIDVRVKAPLIIQKDISIKLILYPSAVNISLIEAKAKEAVVNYCKAMKIGQDFILTQITKSLMIDGVKDILYLSPTNTTIESQEIFKAGLIVVTSEIAENE